MSGYIYTMFNIQSHSIDILLDSNEILQMCIRDRNMEVMYSFPYRYFKLASVYYIPNGLPYFNYL